MDWLATKPKMEKFDVFKNRDIEPWQLMTAGSLSDVQEERNEEENSEGQQSVLRRRQRLGKLCEWTGMARKWAISLATAIDGVTNILLTDAYPENEFKWVIDFKVGAATHKVSFEIKRPQKTGRWESNFTQLEAALSLGLFGDKLLENPLNSPHIKDPKMPKEDWLRSDENMERKSQSVRLLSPSTIVALRDLTWWVEPRTRKLKEVLLYRSGNEKLEIEQYQLEGFASLVSTKEEVLVVK